MAERHSTDFRPDRHTFRFSNDFEDSPFTVVDGLPGIGKLTVQVDGLCIGMASAALDYYLAGINIPMHEPFDFPDHRIPARGSALRNYLQDRNDDVLNYPDEIYKGFANCLLGHPRRAYVRLAFDQELPKIKALVGSGLPALLILPTFVTLNTHGNLDLSDDELDGGSHGMVAYAYEQDGDDVTLLTYDCNFLDKPDGSRITFNRNGDSIRDDSGYDWKGLFVGPYRARTPSYRDLVVSASIQPSSSTIFVGYPAACSFKVKNVGEYSTTVRQLLATLKDYAGNTDLTYLTNQDGRPRRVAAGQELEGKFERVGFMKQPGLYGVTAQFTPTDPVMPVHLTPADDTIHTTASLQVYPAAAAVAPAYGVFVPMVRFGEVVPGGPPVDQELVILNTGELALELNQIILNDSTGRFSIQDGGTQVHGVVLQRGAALNLQVEFTPPAAARIATVHGRDLFEPLGLRSGSGLSLSAMAIVTFAGGTLPDQQVLLYAGPPPIATIPDTSDRTSFRTRIAEMISGLREAARNTPDAVIRASMEREVVNLRYFAALR